MANGNSDFVDKPRSWLIAAAVCMNTVLMFGTLKSKGVFMVSLHEVYNIDRSYAALIFLATYASFFGTAIFGGSITQIFGYRAVLVTGSFIAALGTFLSSFVDTPSYLILTLGFLQGCGFGLCLIPNTAVLGHYFVKHRAKAFGLGFVGGPLGSLIFPPVIQLVIEEYGLRGSFLITSAIVLNMVGFSFIIKTPPTMKTIFSRFSKPKPSLPRVNTETVQISDLDDSSTTNYGTNLSINCDAELPDCRVTRKPSDAIQTSKELSNRMNLCTDLKTMFKTKFYYPILFTVFASNFSLVTFALTIPDFAVLEGSTPQAAAWLISISSGFDMMARVSSGVLLDMKIIRLSFTYAIFLFCCASFMVLISLGQGSYIVLAVAAAGYGLNFGACQIHFPISITNFMGPDLMPLTLSSGSALSMIVTFGTAPLIAYFLNRFGSYIGIYMISAVLFYICSFIWVLIGVLCRR